MRIRNLILSVVLLVFVGCQLQQNATAHASKTTPEYIKNKKEASYLQNWSRAVNVKNSSQIQDFYDLKSIKVVAPDSILTGSDEIAKYYIARTHKIKRISTLFQTEASKEKKINYEIVEYKTEGKKTYIQLVIWKLHDARKIIEFEFTSEKQQHHPDTEESILERRKLWEQLCNEHNPEKLVNQLYTPNSFYYNHKPLIEGRENLIKEYAYMKAENYTLKLHPMKLEFVNNNFAYEIGQCEGSYGGKYILIWEKNAMGQWNILIDSNL